MQANKISAYVGFAIRSNNVLFGVDAAETTKKRVCLMIFDHTLSENSRKTVEKLQAKFKCKVLFFKESTLNELVFRNNCKFIALTDKNLSEAICGNVGENENIEIYPWEEKE